MERLKGIEPSSKAWKALVLPLNYSRGIYLGWRTRFELATTGATIPRSTNWAIFNMARPQGFEPQWSVLETDMLPLHQGRKWCGIVELNHGHKDFQSLALPTELIPHLVRLIGLEPMASRLSGERSNQLSYRRMVYLEWFEHSTARTQTESSTKLSHR